MTKKMLDGAYTLDSREATKKFYDAWAETYEAEVAENGYVTPERCATALANFVTDKSAPILDIGCGTGFSGLALRSAGFEVLDGSDFSPEMLRQAEAKGIYRALVNTDLEDPFPFEPGAYAHVAAIGVLNPGHAPASTLDQVLKLLGRGGKFVFSLNDHALADNTYAARINEYVDAGSATLLFSQYGDHLPKKNLKSNVYVLQKA